MARPPQFKIPAVAELLRQLRYAPPETRRRQMDAAEELVAQLNADQQYPFDFIVFRITSFRSDVRGEPDVWPGAALIADLAKFIERLSDSLLLAAEEYAPRVPLPVDEVTRRLKVSATTIHRYRSQGLIAHKILDEDGRKRVVVFEDALERFIDGRSEQVAQASQFSRIDEETTARVIRRARRYRSSVGASLNEAAQRLARRFDRSPEAIRQLLMRHDERHPGDALFPVAGPLSARDRQVILRAHRFGAPIPKMTKRFSRSRSSIYRVINEERLAKLDSFSLSSIALPTFELEGAADVILSPGSVRRGFDPDLTLAGDASEWVERTARSELPDETTELSWFGAMNFLIHTARDLRDRLDRAQPRAHDLDLIETRLRWATRLKARILAAFQRPILSTLEIHIGRPLLTRPAIEIRRLHALGMRVAHMAVESFDPKREQRFQTYLVFALRRELAKATNEPPTVRAAAMARHTPGAVPLIEFVHRLDPWQEWLEYRPAFRSQTDALTSIERAVIELRAGWTGEAPLTHVDVAERVNLPAERVAAIETRALRRLRARTRGD